MSTRRRIWLILLVLIVLSAFVRYGLGRIYPDIFVVGAPEVSVKAEPVFSIDGSGFHFGPAMFENEVHHPEGFVVTNSMLMAALTVLVLSILALIVKLTARLRPGGFQNFVELVVDGMYNTMGSVDRKYIARFWPLVGTIFFYVLFSNWLALIPGVLSIGYRVDEALLHGEEHAQQVEHGTLASTGASDQLSPADTVVGQEIDEGHSVLVPYLRSPSADLNNTLMLGLVAFFFIEFWGFKELGLSYLSKFFPIGDFKRGIGAGLISMFAGILEFISEFVRIISFAFRLFGNIFAGEVIILVMLFLFPLLPIPFLGLELFVGFIQAFVFAILVMAFASLATQGHGGHDHGPAAYDEPTQAELGGTLRQNPTH